MMLKKLKKDNLVVKIFDNRTQMGQTAAKEASASIHELLKIQHQLNIIFAAAPSQNDFLEALLTQDIDWSRINAFHMDEYIGLPANAPQGFANFLTGKIFSKVEFRNVNYLNGNAGDIDKEIKRYSELLQSYPADIVFMGIGENTHIAFNDPHVANFSDNNLVKIVDLDYACKQQQVNDGCFAHIDDVPKHALTLTVPALINAKFVFCMVPSKNKAKAIYHTLNENISENYPSTILRNHPQAILYTDHDGASLLLSQE